MVMVSLQVQFMRWITLCGTYLFGYSYEMADLIDELNAVLRMCSIDDAMVHANIIARGGFNQLEDLGVLGTDTDVTEMAKRMAAHMLAEGQVLLGTVIIKCLQMLVWWMRDHHKRSLPLEVAN